MSGHTIAGLVLGAFLLYSTGAGFSWWLFGLELDGDDARLWVLWLFWWLVVPPVLAVLAIRRVAIRGLPRARVQQTRVTRAELRALAAVHRQASAKWHHE